MLEKSTRTARIDEWDRIRANARTDIVLNGCSILVFLAFTPAAWWIVGWICSWFSPQAEMIGGMIAGGLGALLSLALTWMQVAEERRRRRNARLDIEDGIVEVWDVQTKHVCRLSNGKETTGLVFDLGDETMLLLYGEWLREDPEIYHAPEQTYRDEAGDDRFNLLPDPFSFPSSEFQIVRLPHSTHVLSIKPQGEYFTPSELSYVIDSSWMISTESIILPGHYKDVQRVLVERWRVANGYE